MLYICAALVSSKQIGAFTVNDAGWKVPVQPDGGLIVATSIHPDPCKKEKGCVRCLPTPVPTPDTSCDLLGCCKPNISPTHKYFIKALV